MSLPTDTICVIGAGTMGTGIAQVAAQAGIHVYLIDVSEEVLAISRERLGKSLEGGIERGKLTPGKAEQVSSRIAWEADCAAVSEAEWVIEAVFEDMAVKERALRQAGAAMRESAILASNTSTFCIGELAELSGRPERFVGLHFFNPVPAMKLVEVIPGEQTLPEVTDAALALCERLGKTAVIAPDIPGFLVNRAFAALVASAIDVWAQGGEPEAIDGALELGLGHKMGPLRSADLVGLDIMLAILRSLHEQTGHERFAPPPEFVSLVEQGHHGRKTGKGFYSYDD